MGVNEGVKPYYDDGSVQIFLGDCRDVLPTLGPVDLVLTDPPYGAETHAGARTNSSTGDLNTPLIDFRAFSASEVADTFAACPTSRWLVSFMEWQHLATLERRPPRGLRFVRFGVWIKPNSAPQLSGDRPATGWEAIGIFHREGGRMVWNGGGRPAVWVENKVNTKHPTGKPIRLVKQLIYDFGGEVILDPFMGSGSTLRAAKDLGRKAIGIEIEEKYCEIAAKRMEQTTLGLALGSGKQKSAELEDIWTQQTLGTS